MPCYHCGKGVLYGRSHTHHRGVAGGRWKKRATKTQRIFHPNLQRMSIIENGEEVRVKLCTKCLKRVKKDVEDGVRPFLQLAQYERQKLVKEEPKKVEAKEKSASSVKTMEDKPVKKAAKPKLKKVKKTE